MTSSFETQRDNLRDCLRGVADSDDILAAGPYKALAEAWAAITERSYIPHPEREAFIRLWQDNEPLASAYVGWYLGEAVDELKSGNSPIGVARLAADLGHPTYRGTALTVAPDKGILRALDEAAFSWFDQSLEHYVHKAAIRLATREAYLAARFNLGGGRNPYIHLARATRLAATTPDKREQGGLCNDVSTLLNAATATVKLSQPRRRR